MTEKLSELEKVKEKIQAVKAEKIVLEEKSNSLSQELKTCKKEWLTGWGFHCSFLSKKQSFHIA